MRAHKLVHLFGISCAIAILALASVAPGQSLQHRYSFDDPFGAGIIEDSVGGATWNGTLFGGAYAADSRLILDGFGSFAALPPGIVSGFSTLTIEFWATFSPNNPVWTRVFAFGDQTDVGSQATGVDYTHYAEGNWQNLNYSTPSGNVWANNPGGLNGRTNAHVTVLVDPPENRMFYYNDTSVASNPGLNGGSTVPPLQQLNDTVNLIGKSLHDFDATLEGEIHEFRIYEGVLTPAMVAVNHAAGPDRYVIDPGSLQSIDLTSPDVVLSVNQSSQQILTGNFANVSGVDLVLYGGAKFESGNSEVLTISSNGLVRAIAPGATTIVARFEGFAATNSLTVQSRPAVLAHRYSFEVDAADSVGDAHGALMSGATVSDGKVLLDANFGSYVDLPGALINIATNDAVTIEAWVDIGDAQAWSRLFNFGTEEASDELYLAPVGPGNGGQHRLSQNIQGGQTIDWAGAWTNTSLHVAVVVDPRSSMLALFKDGVLEYARYDASAPMTRVATNLAVLGRSLVPVDPYLPGAIDEFRIWSGALTPQQIALSFQRGPGSTNNDPGALISMALPSGPYPSYSRGVPPRILLTYQNLTNFDLVPNNSAFVPELMLSSGNPSVIEVLPSQSLRTFAPGSTTVTATYRNVTTTAPVSVSNSAVLAHRYSFVADGSDSIGNADAILHGNATVSGEKLILDGSAETYVDLPPGLLQDFEAVTVDTWVTFNEASTWARLWYFGDDRANEFYIAPSVLNGDAHWFSTGFPIGGETLTRNPRWESETLHITAVYGNGTMELYTNGVLEAGTYTVQGRTDQIGTWFSWIGRSPYPDPFLNAAIDEFRIFNGRLAPEQIRAAHEAGPDELPANPVVLSAVPVEGNLVLRWPGSVTGFTLEERNELSSGSWARLTQTPTLVGGEWELVLPMTGTQRFFRLTQLFANFAGRRK